MAQTTDLNAGLDFTITVKNGHNLKEAFEALQDKANDKYHVFTSFITLVPDELEATNSIIIRGFRPEILRSKRHGINKSLQVLSMVKEWLDSHGKTYHVETHADLISVVK